MQQRRSLPPSSSTGRRGRQPQTPRSRPLCSWEVLGVATLLVLTIVNVCTYSERRAKFQHAHGGALHTSDDDNGLPEHSRRVPAPRGKVSERTGGNAVGSGQDVYVASVGRPGGNVDASGTRRPGTVGGAFGGGGGDRSGGGAGEETLVGSGGWKWTNKTTGPVRPLSPPTPPAPPTPPTPSLLPYPLGRDAPLQVAVMRPSNDAGGGSSGRGMNSWQWPSDAGAGSGGSVGGVSEVDSVVGHFPCSLTEADDAPGPGHRGGGGGGNVAAARKQRLTPWSTSGPCVVSCSPPSSSSSTASGARQLVEARGPEDQIGGGGVAVTPIGGAPVGGSGGLERCERAARACDLYQECTHVLLPPGGGGGDGHSSGSGNRSGNNRNGGRFAVLMHRMARDVSMAGVDAAAAAAAAHAAGGGNGGGGPKGGFTLDAKPRTYYVVSFGGSGSKMLGGWLSERGKGMVKEVFHIHDPRPGDKLFAKVARRGVSAGGGGGRGKDFRGYDFPEGDFPSGGTAV
ncbi:unnamed protein product, partial [Ectocarpus sp. 12 AP-2014]